MASPSDRADPRSLPRGPAGRVYLVRHGRTELNAGGRLRGLLDPPLDEQGREEVQRTARALTAARFAAVFCSPLTRAVETAQAICTAAGLPRPQPLHELLDRDYGEWTGKREEDVITRWGSIDAAPGVEPRRQVAERARRFLTSQAAALCNDNIAAVTHDAVLRELVGLAEPDQPVKHFTTAGWTVMRLTAADQWQLLAFDQSVTDNAPTASSR